MDFNWESRRSNIRNHKETLTILESEVKAILEKLKTDKCPGPDKINNQNLRTLSTVLNKLLTVLFNEILEKEYIPDQW